MSAESGRNKRNNLKEGILKLYETKDFSDITFTVGKKMFKAHKLILSSRCSELSRILMDPNCPENIIVEGESVTAVGFEILLRFIYTDSLGTDDLQSIVEAYLAATLYKQSKLKENCEELLLSFSITVDNVCELLNVSLIIIRLKEKCLNFIKSKALKVIDSPTFFKLNYYAMVCILENDVLKEVGVKKRIMRIVEWGAKQENCTDNYARVRDYFLKFDPPLLSKLKMEELSLDEFGELFTVNYVGLLKPEEIMKFVQYGVKKDKAILPTWRKTP